MENGKIILELEFPVSLEISFFDSNDQTCRMLLSC